MRKIHILTISWNGYELLHNLRAGLGKNLASITMKDGLLKEGWDYPEWYIRDNGSKDNTVEKIKHWKFRSDMPLGERVFSIGHNRDNFSQGVNYLFEKANPKDDDLILLLNNDIEFNDDISLLNMVNLMTPDVGVVGAKLLYPGTNKLQHAGVIFSEQYGLMPYHFRHKEESDSFASLDRYFQAVTGACCLIRAYDFKNSGKLNVGLNWAFEDISACLSIGKTKKIAYCGKTNISHGESKTLALNPVNKMFLQQNVKLFKDTWFGKYEIDHGKYLTNKSYNEIKVK
jgi:GT2 family glycosyltransferase